MMRAPAPEPVRSSSGRMGLDQHGQPEVRFADADRSASSRRSSAAAINSTASAPCGAGLDDLRGVDDEVLPKDGQVAGASGGHQVVERAAEVRGLGEHGERGRPARLVLRCPRGRVRLGDRPGRRRCPLSSAITAMPGPARARSDPSAGSPGRTVPERAGGRGGPHARPRPLRSGTPCGDVGRRGGIHDAGQSTQARSGADPASQAGGGSSPSSAVDRDGMGGAGESSGDVGSGCASGGVGRGGVSGGVAGGGTSGGIGRGGGSAGGVGTGAGSAGGAGTEAGAGSAGGGGGIAAGPRSPPANVAKPAATGSGCFDRRGPARRRSRRGCRRSPARYRPGPNDTENPTVQHDLEAIELDVADRAMEPRGERVTQEVVDVRALARHLEYRHQRDDRAGHHDHDAQGGPSLRGGPRCDQDRRHEQHDRADERRLPRPSSDQAFALARSLAIGSGSRSCRSPARSRRGGSRRARRCRPRPPGPTPPPDRCCASSGSLTLPWFGVLLAGMPMSAEPSSTYRPLASMSEPPHRPLTPWRWRTPRPA